MKYLIFTDLTCDLTKSERKQYGIWPEVFMQEMTCNDTVVPQHDIESFYAHFENDEYPAGQLKTATCGVAEAYRVLDDILEHGDPDAAIVYVGVSTHMSSTPTTVKLALTDYAEKYPERKFIYVDSHCISNGLATFLEYLAKYDGDDIGAYADGLSKHIMHLFTLRDLSYAANSGRYSGIERLLMLAAGKLHLIPWMYAPSDDKLKSGRTIRGSNRILHEWIKYYQEHVADDNEFVRIGYGGAAERPRAEKFIRLLKEQTGLTDAQIQLTHVSPIVAAHTGSTVLSFFFKQKDERPEH